MAVPDCPGIAKYLGGSATESSVEHRFRAIKAQADVVKGLVERGEDPELYKVYEIKNKGGKITCRSQPAAPPPRLPAIPAAVGIAAKGS